MKSNKRVRSVWLSLCMSAGVFLALPVQAQTVPRPNHVVIVIEENHSYSEIIGSGAAPYINSLAQQGALFTASFAVTHPSEPNYLALFSGSTQGVTDDSCPHTFVGSNLASQLIGAGLTFGGYSEDMPSVGYTGCTFAAYARKHNPWVNWQGVNVPAADNMPYAGYFPSNFSALPTVSIVVPNLNNDMHDGTIQQGDAWLQNNLSGYVQWANANNSLLILTWDEDDQNNRIPTIFVGPMVKPGQYGETITHYNVLDTIQAMYGLPQAAAPITDVWTSSGGPSPPSSLTATAVSSSQINLSWTESDTSVTGFVVQRSTDGINFTSIATLGNVRSYADTGLAASTLYYYRVYATNSAGSSGSSNVASATTQGAGASIPAAPSNLTARALGNAKIHLVWTDNSTNETGFAIEESTNGGVTFGQIDTVGAGSTSDVTTARVRGMTYWYRVRAFNGAGYSGYSNIVSATAK